MLVLSRKEGERLVIGDNIVVTINRISGNRVTLGIEAPRDVRIVRGELDQRDAEERPVAAPYPNASASFQGAAVTVMHRSE